MSLEFSGFGSVGLIEIQGFFRFGISELRVCEFAIGVLKVCGIRVFLYLGFVKVGSVD